MAEQKFGITAKKQENFHDWYTQLVVRSELVDYYDIRGLFVMRPTSMFIWSEIRKYFDERISNLGVKECYFPMLVTRKCLEVEKNHLDNFNPELAWVTTCGDKKLDEPVALRPTSEAIMYPYYSRWIRTHRDLPLQLNQWCSVIRWEVKSTLPFIRGREFLWQEGHSAFYKPEDAIKEAKDILEIYASVYEDLLAVPVIRGLKSKNETFGGADYTLTVEAFIPSTGRGIQGATSHHLGNNFSKMFDIKVESSAGTAEKEYVYQNSWGITTRAIGVAAMLHSDDLGFVCPPKVASIQVVIVMCGIKAHTNLIEIRDLHAYAESVRDELSKKYRIHLDDREHVSPAYKFNHWELRGVPLRIEIGFRDLKNNEISFVRRDTGIRRQVNRILVAESVEKELNEMHLNLYSKALDEQKARTKKTDSFDEMQRLLNEKCIVIVPWCGGVECEKEITRKTTIHSDGDESVAQAGAKSLCMPFDASTAEGKGCINCDKNAGAHVLFGRSY